MALGEPDAGKPPVRFDEGRSETVIGLCLSIRPLRLLYCGFSVVKRRDTRVREATSDNVSCTLDSLRSKSRLDRGFARGLKKCQQIKHLV